MILPDPEQAAIELLKKTGQSDAPIDLDRIIQLWPEIRVATDSLERDGYIVDMGAIGVEIVVRAGTGLPRKRYTIAHELGHWFLYNCASIPISGNSVEAHDRIERWCNRFAAHLLIPQNTVRDLCTWESLSIEKLQKKAAELQVSARTMLWRVLEETPYEGGALYFRMMGKPRAPHDVKLRLEWGLFPKSTNVHLYKFGLVDYTSPIYEALGKPCEELYENVKLDFGSLRGRRNLLIKSFHGSVLAIVIPPEISISKINLPIAPVMAFDVAPNENLR